MRDTVVGGGGPQGMKLRTFSLLPCWIGVVRDAWSQGTLVVHPVRQNLEYYNEDTFIMESRPKEKHVIHLALNWREALKAGLVGSCAEIGQRVGLSDGRVRQIVRMADLHPEIVAFLQSLRSESELKAFPERRLRSLSPFPMDRQLDAFRTKFQAEIGG